MEEFWKVAVGIAGIGAIGAFVFYSLYRRWLKVEVGVFSSLRPEDTYRIFRLFLVLTFLFAIAALAAFFFTPSSRDRAENIKIEIRSFNAARFNSLLRIIDNQLAFYDQQNDAEGRKLAEKLKADVTALNNAREAAIDRGSMAEVLQYTNDLVLALEDYQRVTEQRYADKGGVAQATFQANNAALENFLLGLRRMTTYARMPDIKERLERNPNDLKLLREYESRGRVI